MGVAGGAGFGGGHLGHWPEIIELTRVEDAEPNAAADTSK